MAREEYRTVTIGLSPEEWAEVERWRAFYAVKDESGGVMLALLVRDGLKEMRVGGGRLPGRKGRQATRPEEEIPF